MENEKLRTEVKEINKQNNVSFKYFAQKIGLKNNSFYNFLSGAKGLSAQKQELLKKEIRRFQDKCTF